MALRLELIAVAAAVFSGAAHAEQATTEPAKAPPSCEGQIFTFEAGPAGHVAKVTLCSKKDPTPDELAKMFESAASALAQNLRMAPEKRNNLIAQMKAKAAEARGTSSAAGLPTMALQTPIAPSTTPVTAGPAPLRPITADDRAPEYSSLPPLPTPTPVVGASTAAASTASFLSKPQLTIVCLNQAGLAGAAPCDSLERETILSVRAGDGVPAGTSMRFLRRGDLRAEVQLAGLARGKAKQFSLPREVCAGVVESKVEIQIVRRAKAADAGQVVDSMGPYFLRC